MRKRITRFLSLTLALVMVAGTIINGNFMPAAKVSAIDNGWASDNGSYSYYIGGNAVNGYVEFTTDTVCADDGVTFRKGLYYFANNILDLNARGIMSGPVSVIGGTAKAGMLIDHTKTTVLGKTVTSSISYYTGAFRGKVYCGGQLFTGLSLRANGQVWAVNKGAYSKAYTGTNTSGYVNETDRKYVTADYRYYKNGKAFTGVQGLKYFNAGVFQSSYTGWKKVGTKIYYFSKGVACTGWKTKKSYSGGSKKYKYFFEKDGSLCTDLFKKNYKKYIKQPITIKVNLTTHNVTFYLYNKKTKTYNIPARSCICSTARDGKSTKVGNWRLEKTTARRWFIYKKSNPWHYYQWGTHIKGISSWFHSTCFRTTNVKTLIVNGSSGYNRLGTNQTTTCVRLQAVNAKLVYDISTKTNKKARVWVKIFRSSDKGPFGVITLKDTTGKLKSSQKYDPTIPLKKQL